jgi:uncharacterized protein
MNAEMAPAGAVPPIIPAAGGHVAQIPQRLESLDVLRGFAVLGILIMNIQSFSMIEAAYMNPAAYGDLTGVNRWVWHLSHVFADQKFMTIFSLLFGAGMALMAEKSVALGRSAAGLHYRRMFWLLIIGLAHAFLFWFGDILVTYALAGAVAFLFRKIRPHWLTFWALAALAVPSLVFLAGGLSLPYWPADALRDLQQDWQPDAAAVARELEAYRGGWLGQLAHRAPNALLAQTGLFLLWTGWRAGGLMLLGMALLKWSVLSARKPVRFYAVMALGGAAFGLPLIINGAARNFEEDWSATYSLFFGSQWNYWGSLGVAFAYMALVMLAQRQQWLGPVRRALADVGRMALTNYLLQTLICTTLFYGHCFGWYGRVERWQQVVVVVAVWIFQVGFTLAWLRFRPQGPLEYLWRALTYFRFRSA